MRDLERVGTVAKIDDKLIVRHVDLDAAVEHARHRHVFQPHRVLLFLLPRTSVVVRGRPAAAAVDARDARRAVAGGGVQQRRQRSFVPREVPDVGDEQGPVYRLGRHVLAPPASVAAERRHQRAVVARRVRVADRRDARHVASTQAAARADARQRTDAVEVEAAEIGHEAIRVVAARPPSFAREVVLRPVVLAKHLGCTDLRRVIDRRRRRDAS